MSVGNAVLELKKMQMARFPSLRTENRSCLAKPSRGIYDNQPLTAIANHLWTRTSNVCWPLRFMHLVRSAHTQPDLFSARATEAITRGTHNYQPHALHTCSGKRVWIIKTAASSGSMPLRSEQDMQVNKLNHKRMQQQYRPYSESGSFIDAIMLVLRLTVQYGSVQTFPGNNCAPSIQVSARHSS